MQPVDLALVATFSLTWPLFGARFGVPALKAAVASGTPGARRTQYLDTMFQLWTFAALAAAAAIGAGRSAESLRLLPPTGVGLAIAVAAIGATILLFRAQANAVESPEGRAAIGRQVAPLAYFLPQDTADRNLFRALSVTAGVCEEWLFRGYLVALLEPALGLAGAVAASTALFGIAHAYQGPVGMLRTGIVGLIFAGLTVATGSILPAMVVHAVVDWMQGDLITRVLGGERVPQAA
jgi:membrane protease YdiL (CAAX protease family)